MNTVKNNVALHLRLSWIDVLEVLILLMTYLIRHVFEKKTEDLNLTMISGKNESKILTT